MDGLMKNMSPIVIFVLSSIWDELEGAAVFFREFENWENLY